MFLACVHWEGEVTCPHRPVSDLSLQVCLRDCAETLCTGAGCLSCASGSHGIPCDVCVVSGVQVTADAASAIATAPALRTLVLSGCPQIDDTALLALSRGCPALEVTELEDAEGGPCSMALVLWLVFYSLCSVAPVA